MKNFITLFTFIFIIVLTLSITSCSDDSDNAVTPPPTPTGEVLLATVTGDSVVTASGLATKSSSITGSQLNFTDRSNARITFFYSSGSTNTVVPFQILYNDSVVMYSGNIANNATDQFIDTTFASPNVNSFFKYRISVGSTTPSFFKFRDLKIYKK